MNIFVTDLDPVKAAQNLDDKRVKHMPKESIELLAIYVHSVTGTWLVPFPLWGDENRNQPQFLYNHPISKWVRKDKANTYWLSRHLDAMFEEHLYRFDEYPMVRVYFPVLLPYISAMDREPFGFHNSSLFKNKPIVQAYRDTMMQKWFVTDKIKPPKWTKRGAPYWIEQQQSLEL